MSDNTKAGTAWSNTVVIGTLGFLACCFMFAYLAYVGVARHGLMTPVVLGWIVAFITMRPLVDRDRHTALYFAFGVLALMIFFIHQTYGYSGRVRNFPLIIGYTGVVICILDVLSLSRLTIGSAISHFFGSHLDVKEMNSRPVNREIIAFAAMGGCVLGLWLFGFLVFSPIFVGLWMLVGGKPVKHSVYGSVFTLIFIYLLFEVAFQYELYRGIVFIWLLDL
jgi:hypothetical protein